MRHRRDVGLHVGEEASADSDGCEAPAVNTPSRLREVAVILARAYLRLRARQRRRDPGAQGADAATRLSAPARPVPSGSAPELPLHGSEKSPLI